MCAQRPEPQVKDQVRYLHIIFLDMISHLGVLGSTQSFIGSGYETLGRLEDVSVRLVLQYSFHSRAMAERGQDSFSRPR